MAILEEANIGVCVRVVVGGGGKAGHRMHVSGMWSVGADDEWRAREPRRRCVAPPPSPRLVSPVGLGPPHPSPPFPPAVCTTLSFSGSSSFTRLTRKFDVVVVDEAAQVGARRSAATARLCACACACARVLLAPPAGLALEGSRQQRRGPGWCGQRQAGHAAQQSCSLFHPPTSPSHPGPLQAVEPATLVPLAHGGAQQVFLVGDPVQLPATVMSQASTGAGPPRGAARGGARCWADAGCWEAVAAAASSARPGLPPLPARHPSVPLPCPLSLPQRALAQGYCDSLFKRLQGAGYPVHMLDTQVGGVCSVAVGEVGWGGVGELGWWWMRGCCVK